MPFHFRFLQTSQMLSVFLLLPILVAVGCSSNTGEAETPTKKEQKAEEGSSHAKNPSSTSSESNGNVANSNSSSKNTGTKPPAEVTELLTKIAGLVEKGDYLTLAQDYVVPVYENQQGHIDQILITTNASVLAKHAVIQALQKASKMTPTSESDGNVLIYNDIQLDADPVSKEKVFQESQVKVEIKSWGDDLKVVIQEAIKTLEGETPEEIVDYLIPVSLLQSTALGGGDQLKARMKTIDLRTNKSPVVEQMLADFKAISTQEPKRENNNTLAVFTLKQVTGVKGKTAPDRLVKFEKGEHGWRFIDETSADRKHLEDFEGAQQEADTVSVKLVKSEGQWKLFQITGPFGL